MEFSGSLEEEAADIYNKEYSQLWEEMLRSSRVRLYYRHVARKYQRSFEGARCSLLPCLIGRLSHSVREIFAAQLPRCFIWERMFCVFLGLWTFG
jgi:hypothetical protein